MSGYSDTFQNAEFGALTDFMLLGAGGNTALQTHIAQKYYTSNKSNTNPSLILPNKQMIIKQAQAQAQATSPLPRPVDTTTVATPTQASNLVVAQPQIRQQKIIAPSIVKSHKTILLIIGLGVAGYYFFFRRKK